MKRIRRYLILAQTLCCLLATGVASAQDASPGPPSLALMISGANGSQASTTTVPPTGVATQWFPMFERLPGWKEPEGALPILAVRFARRMDGARANVRVTIHRGVKFYDVEEFVSEYNAAAGDSYVVKELEKFGIKPFEFSVVKNVEAEPRAVAAKFHTTSLEAVSVGVDQKLSMVKLVLRNLSTKDVVALKLETRYGEQTVGTRWPLGVEGRPIVEAGGVGEVMMAYGDRAERKGDGYAPLPPDAVVVESALFADGSYEGELQAASHSAADYAGYRIYISRVLELARQTLNSGDADKPGAGARFKQGVLALGRDADPYTVGEVYNAYPGLAEGERELLKGEIETAMSWMRQDVLAQVAPFEANGVGGKVTFRDWLTAYEQKLDAWLARLRR
jgi:hypothetical protein